MDNQDKNTQPMPVAVAQNPISVAPNKEQAPIAPFMRASEVLPPNELKEFGVDVIDTQSHPMPTEIQNVGVSYSGPNVPVPVRHSSWEIPTPKEARAQSKGPVSESKTWRAAEFVKSFLRGGKI